MEQRGIILVGGGGHALVVAGSIQRLGLAVGGFLDDRADAVLAAGPGSIDRVGTLSDLRRLLDGGASALLAVGDLTLRRRLIESAGAWDAAVTLIDPAGVVCRSDALGIGVYVGAGAIVQERAEVGAHTIINTGAIVEHECRLGVNVHVAPGAVLGGRVVVGSDVLIGLGSRVLPGVRIGAGCVIGAGAVVTRDLAPGSRVAGVPARAI